MDVTLTEWRPVPSLLVRRMKTNLEDELLFRRGANADWVDVHPLVRLGNVGRSKSDLCLQYGAKQKQVTRKKQLLMAEMLLTSPADRQLSRVNRMGPRHRDLSHPPLKQVEPDVIWRQAWANERQRFNEQREKILDTVFNTWRAIRPLSDRSMRLHKRKRKSTLVRPLPTHDVDTCFTDSSLLITRQTDHVTTLKELMQTTAWWKSAPKRMLRSERQRYEVLVYVCSTPDMAEEREFLAEVTFPEIERACENLGLSVRIKDLRLGYDRLADDRESSRICLEELDKCIRQSLGTYFLAVIGNEVDGTKLPHQIESGLFEKLRMIVLRERASDLDLLDDVYRLDNNSIPPAYYLNVEELFNGTKCTERLQETLEESVKHGVVSGTLDLAEVRRINLSLTHLEVEKGILQSTAPDMTSICLMSPDTTVTPEDDDDTHLTTGSITSLRSDIIKCAEHQSCDNLFMLKHKQASNDYFKHLHETAKSQVVQQIADCVKACKFDIRNHTLIDTELHNHSYMTEQYASYFGGPDDALDKIRHLLTLYQGKVVCLYGERGCGKTLVMAKLAMLIPTWYEFTSSIIVRFVGRTIESKHMSDILRTVCIELFLNCNVDEQHTEPIKDMIISNNTAEALKMICALVSKHIWIVLDGIDNAINGDKLSEWLPDRLPETITIVLSCRKETYDGLSNIDRTQIMADCDCTSILEPQMCSIAANIISRRNRRLTEDQIQILVDKMTEEVSPLLLSFVMHDTVGWVSSFLPDKDYLSRSTDTVIDHILLVTERRHGRVYVKYVLSYLAVVKYGLTEKELTELVSKNETFLMNQIDEGYSSTEGTLLHMLVTRLLSEFTMVLEEMKCDAENVLQISSSDFALHVIKRYIHKDFLVELHLNIAEYFIRKTQTLISMEDNFEGKWLMMFGSRRLCSILYHLTQANTERNPQNDKIKSHCLLNFNWLISRISTGNTHRLTQDFETVMKSVDDAILAHFYDCLKQCGNITSDEFVFVLSSILDYMSRMPEKSAHVLQASSQFKQWLIKSKLILLRPKQKNNHVYGSIEKTVTNIRHIIHVDELRNRILLIDCNRCIAWLDILTTEKINILDSEIQDDTISAYLNGHMLFIHTSSSLIAFDIEQATRNVIANFTRDLPKYTRLVGTKCILFRGDSVLLVDLVDASVTIIEELRGSQSIEVFSNDNNFLVGVTNEAVQFYNMETQLITKRIQTRHDEQLLHDNSLLMTKDHRFVVVTSEKHITVIDSERLCFFDEFSCPPGVFTNCALNMCTEHAFVVNDRGELFVIQIRTCAILFTINVNCSRNCHVTCQTFSEDDHFLIVGFSNGQISIYNVPTQRLVIQIQAHKSSIKRLKFIRSRKSFENLISEANQNSDVRLYNLQNVLLQARKKLLHLINDRDLQIEEKAKLNAGKYYGLFKPRKSDRIFLNGADVSAFYKQMSRNHFSSLERFGLTIPSERYWMNSKVLRDLRSFDTHCLHRNSNQLVTQIGQIFATWNSENGVLLKYVSHEHVHDCHTTLLKLSRTADYITQICENGDSYKAIKVWHVDSLDLKAHIPEQIIVAVSNNGDHIMCCENRNSNGENQYWAILWDNNTQEKILNCPIAAGIDISTCNHSFISDNGHLWTIIVECKNTSQVLITDTRITLRKRQAEHSRYLGFTQIDIFGVVNTGIAISDSTKLLLAVSDNLLVIADVLEGKVTHIADHEGFKRIPSKLLERDQSKIKTPITKHTSSKTSELVDQNQLKDYFESIKSLCKTGCIKLLVDNPDGDMMVSVTNSTVNVWKKSQLECVGTITSLHTAQLSTVAISYDDAYITTGTDSGMVQVWEAGSCHLVSCHPILDVISSLQYTYNGDIMVVTGNRDRKRIYVFSFQN